MGLLLIAVSECVHFGEEFSELFNPFFGVEEVGWYYVLFVVM
jgi:hypothetical protein